MTTGGAEGHPRRVLVFAPTFEPGFKAGGTIKSMVQLLDHLPASVAVTLVTGDRDLGDTDPYPGLSGQRVRRGQHEVFYLDRRSPRQWFRLVRGLRRRRFELVNVNGLWSPLFTIAPLLATELGLFRTRRTLLTVHGTTSVGALGIKSRKKRAFLGLWSPFLRHLDPLFQATTEPEDRDVRRLFPWARTTVAPNSWADLPSNGVDVSRDRARFVFISRISAMKNLELALRALSLVQAEVDFDVFGPIEDEPYWNRCQALIAAMPANVRVTYGGSLRPDQVRATFAAYDASLLPTRGENFGYVIAESLSAGCPVVCSAHSAWTEVLGAGGGEVVIEDAAEAWAIQLQCRAGKPAAERTADKQRALASYRIWQSGQPHASAVEQALPPASPRRSQRRIAMVTHNYRPGAGGIETAARSLVGGLQEAGHDVVVFDLTNSRGDGLSRHLGSPATWSRRTLLHPDAVDPAVVRVGANGVELEPLRYLPRRSLTTELSQFDLVHVMSGGPALALAAMRCGRPVVVHTATTVAWEREALLLSERAGIRWGRTVMTKLTTRLEAATVRRADVVLVMNRVMAEHVGSLSNRPVRHCPPGVDSDLFAPAGRGWDPRGYLLSVCRLSDSRKGLDRLVRSYALLRGLRPDAPSLVLAGRGVPPRSLCALISDLGLTAHVEVRTDVPLDELPGLYRGASVYLQASYEEGFGISVVEAMASGVPTAASDTAGTRETVAHGVTGWLVPQGGTFEQMLAGRVAELLDGAGKAMSLSCRDRAVEVFSRRATLRTVESIHNGLLAPSTGMPA